MAIAAAASIISARRCAGALRRAGDWGLDVMASMVLGYEPTPQLVYSPITPGTGARHDHTLAGRSQPVPRRSHQGASAITGGRSAGVRRWRGLRRRRRLIRGT